MICQREMFLGFLTLFSAMLLYYVVSSKILFSNEKMKRNMEKILSILF